MWTVTVDSNVPLHTKSNSELRDSKSRSSSAGRPRSSESYLRSRRRDGDVEDLLGSQSSNRPVSPGLRGLPPRSGSPVRSRSHSPNKPPSPSTVSSRNRNYWHQEWTKALETAVDDPDAERARRLNTSLDGALHLDSGGLGKVEVDGGLVKALHDPSMSIQDSDSGIWSLKNRSGPLSTDDTRSLGLTTPRLSRSRSMSRLNSSLNSETMSLPGLSSVRPSDPGSRSARELQVSLEDSESRRSVLMHKLKEAQNTLELQNGRLSKIENAARENNSLVENLKFKEKEYRKKITQLESSEEEKQRFQLENIRLREEMQERISALDYQLKSLKNQHRSNENENDKRISLLDHTTAALSLLEEENAKLQQDKEKLQHEVSLMKEAFQRTKSRFGALDDDNKNLKNDSIRLRDDNQALTRKVQEMAGQMIELRSLLQAVKDENERLSSSWKDSAEDKSRTARQVENYQDIITDIKARLAATSADRDRLFSEKLEMSSKIQQMVLDKEQMMKAKLNLEDQINDQYSQRSYKRPTDSRNDKDIKELTKELASVKKVSEELSAELASVKGFYENASEQVATLERNKSLWLSHQDLGDQERKRLQAEIDRLSQMLTSRSQDDKREQQYQEEMIQKLRNELKQLKLEKHGSENKVQELEVKLDKANEGLREGSALQHSEIDTWKNTCERLTASVSRKESELQNLTDRCHELEDAMSGIRQEMRILKDKNDNLSDKDEEADRLKEENRKLLQEKAENEQMMKLLETQKEVLSKSSEDNINKLSELEKLYIQMDGIRDQNECLRKRTQELERVSESLMKEKEELMLDQDIKSPGLAELEKKMDELRDANKQLREVNEVMSQKLDTVNQENTSMRQNMGKSLTKTESEKIQEDHLRLQAEFNNLKHEYGALDAKHQRFVINYGHDGEVAAKEKQDLVKVRKERDAMQKQVTLLQGQMSLLEGSKKRAEEQITKLTSELGESRAQVTQMSSSGEAGGAGLADSNKEAMQKEIESLRQQLEKARDGQKVQGKMMKNLREESLEDVETELQQMRGKLQQLMEEIQGKEHTIDSLEAELRASRQTANSRGDELELLQSNMTKVDEENKELRQNLEEIKKNLQAELAQEEEESILKRSVSEMTLQEELKEAVRAKQNGSSIRSRTPTHYLSRSLNQLDLRPASAPPLQTEPVPDKSATEGSDRLQSLISKYRSHNDNQPDAGQKTVKPLPGFVSSKLVSKGRSVTPKAPMRRTSDPEPSISPLAKQDGHNPSPIMSSRTPRKIPPPPPPKPPSPTTGIYSFQRTLSPDNDSGEKSGVSSTGKPSALKALAASSGGESSLRAQNAPATTTGSTRSLGTSGLGTTSSENLNDSGEQKDINALIQKMSLFDEMAAF